MGYERAEVICPFYRYDEQKRIVCEGLQDQSTLSQYFSRKKRMEKYLEYYCCRHCTDCEILRMLMRVKYPDV